VAWCGLSGEARAGSPFLEAVPAEAMRSPAYRYANMTNEEAFAELDRRRILYVREQPTYGVRAPIRLTGRLHGVHVHSSLPPEARPTTPFEILDARLALAVDDFCAILALHDVDEVVHYTMYRPNVAPPGAGAGAPASRPAATKKRPGSAKRRPAAKGSSSGKAPKTTKGSKGGGKSAAGSPRSRQKTFGEPTSSEGWGPLEPKDGFGEEALFGLLGHDELVELLGLEHAHDEHAHDGHAHDGHAHGDGAGSFAAHDGDALAKGAPSGAGRSKGGKGSSSVKKTARRTSKALRRSPARDDDGERENHRKWAPPGTRHPAGLAIDVGAVKKRDGRWLSVASHFDGKLGQRTCGPGAPVPVSAEARELRAIVCEAREAGVFTYALTPNFNVAHADHVHFEIKPGVTWFLYH
jgi:hypothetical protein